MRRGPRPDPYSYLSYRDYLRDWFRAQKAADARFSHRNFARRAGVKSPSLLNEVIGGKRNLTPRTLEGFVRALGLTAEGAAFFAALVQLDQADTDEERNEAWERVAASRRFRSARPIVGPAMSYLSTWYLPAIRELALCRGFRADPAWVAARLLPRITVAQAREALRILFELGLLVDEDGAVSAPEVSVATPHEVIGLAVHNYHHQMLERARDAIEGVDPEERHLGGVTVAIPGSLVPTLKAEVERFQERVLHLCDERAHEAERVYQINLQLLPLSRAPEDSR